MEDDHWRWGDPERSVSLADFPELRAFLEARWETSLDPDFEPPDGTRHLPETRLSEDDVRDTFPDLQPRQCSTADDDRLAHALGKSYHDLIRLFTGTPVPAPDVVVYPDSVEDLRHIVERASGREIELITFSGGSSVTGALEVEDGADRPTASLDMRRLDEPVALDERSHTATFQAGIAGPDLESHLREHGLTLGHFPQSFEHSTLGGWLATRSAGQESGAYGKIEDMVLGMKVVTPAGLIETTGYPRHASGVDTYPLFLGSEGTLGVIAEATLRVRRRPDEYQWLAALFEAFEAGIEGVRHVLQSGLRPGIVRLSDPMETRFLSTVSDGERTGLSRLVRAVTKRYLRWRGFTEPCLLVLGQPVLSDADRATMRAAKSVLERHGARFVPTASASTWEEQRFALPYLRDSLLEHRLLIDTFETVAHWDDAADLYRHVFRALDEESDYFEAGGLLFCHLSHVYETGTSLYFTLLAPQERGHEVEQWRELKRIATEAVVERGGAVSHHHGVGKDHREWYRRGLSDEERALLGAIKGHLDPAGVLNPGKLFDDATR